MILSCVLISLVLHQSSFAQSSTLEQRRYALFRNVLSTLADEFDQQAIAGLGESNFTAHVLFPTGSSQQMFLVASEGRFPGATVGRCRIKFFRHAENELKLIWSSELTPGKSVARREQGTLAKFLRLNHPSFTLSDRKRELRESRSYAAYRFNKIGALSVIYVNPKGVTLFDDDAAEAFHRSRDGESYLRRHGFPRSKWEASR